MTSTPSSGAPLLASERLPPSSLAGLLSPALPIGSTFVTRLLLPPPPPREKFEDKRPGAPPSESSSLSDNVRSITIISFPALTLPPPLTSIFQSSSPLPKLISRMPCFQAIFWRRAGDGDGVQCCGNLLFVIIHGEGTVCPHTLALLLISQCGSLRRPPPPPLALVSI